MKTLLKFSWLFSVLFLLMISCSNSTEPEQKNDNPSDGPDKVSFIEIETSISSNNTNSYAITVKNQVESLDSYFSSLLSTDFGGFGWKKDGNTWTYEYSYGGNGFKYQVIDNGTSYSYKYYFTSTSGDIKYNNFLWYEGTYSIDGLTGTWKYYDTDNGATGRVLILYTFSKNASTNVVTVNEKMFGDDSNPSKITYEYDAVVNADKSGTLLVKLNGVRYEEADWAANGSGHYKLYQNDGTTVLTNESWAANP